MQCDGHLASGDLCHESVPLGQGSRASLLVDLPRNEMAYGATIWERRVNQDEKKQPGVGMIVACGGLGKA
jgi:hypothetical protein